MLLWKTPVKTFLSTLTWGLPFGTRRMPGWYLSSCPTTRSVYLCSQCQWSATSSSATPPGPSSFSAELDAYNTTLLLPFCLSLCLVSWFLLTEAASNTLTHLEISSKILWTRATTRRTRHTQSWIGIVQFSVSFRVSFFDKFVLLRETTWRVLSIIRCLFWKVNLSS